jgi:hypothetical protein
VYTHPGVKIAKFSLFKRKCEYGWCEFHWENPDCIVTNEPKNGSAGTLNSLGAVFTGCHFPACLTLLNDASSDAALAPMQRDMRGIPLAFNFLSILLLNLVDVFWGKGADIITESFIYLSLSKRKKRQNNVLIMPPQKY